MPWTVYLLIAAFIGLAIVAARAAAKRAQERRDALTALAARRGWSFSPDEDETIASELSEFPAFSQGHSRAGYNTLRGTLRISELEYAITCGDYTYKVTSSNGKTTTTVTYEFSYVVAKCPFPRLPDLVIRHESFMDKIGAVIGMADINFESAEFSKAFYVKGPDRKFAFDVIHPRMIEFLMASNPPPIQLSERRICFGADGYCWSPEKLDASVEFVTKFFGLWPQYLLDDLEGRS